MAGNNGGPWGGGGNKGSGGGDDGNRGGGNRPPNNEGPNIPDIDELVNKGREQLRVLMGGGGNGGNRTPGSGGGGPQLTRGTVGIGLLAAIGLWLFASFYTVRPEERAVELFLGEYYRTTDPGLNFAPWPVITREVLGVSTERNIDVGVGRTNEEAGLMLTGDENIVDIEFQVVWNIIDPQQYLFNLADPPQTIAAVSESAMREIISQSELAPILNRDRGVIADSLQLAIQSTLDSYDSGVNIIRVNFDRADPPEPVIASFRAVQDARQERDRVQNVADAYANQVVAEARGRAAQVLEQAEGYRARVVNEAEGEASRFLAVLGEYEQAPEVTRQRIFLETMEGVLGGIDIIILDEGEGDNQNIVPYLPLNEIRRNTTGATN